MVASYDIRDVNLCKDRQRYSAVVETENKNPIGRQRSRDNVKCIVQKKAQLRFPSPKPRIGRKALGIYF
jgi:hypothetical protein